MATVALTPHPRTNEEGESVVRLRISHSGQRRFLSTRIKVKKGSWSNAKSKVTSSHVAHNRINARLSEVEATAEQVLARLQSRPEQLTADWIRDEILEALASDSDGGPGGFLEFAHEKLAVYERRGQTGTWKSYNSVISKFEEFLTVTRGRADLPFHRLDPALIEDFRTYCLEVRGNAQSTTSKALHVLRTFTRKAMKAGHLETYPFEHVTIQTYESEREKLTPEEIEQLAEVELDPASVEAEVRRWFLFSYYTGGMRFSDVATLRPKHIQEGTPRRLQYKMQKTEDVVAVPLVEEAEQILSHYDGVHGGGWVFPILKGMRPGNDLVQKKESQNAKANKYLKKLRDRAELQKNVTFHLARNAAAWRLYQRIGDIYKVSKILGHSSVEQTEKYLDGFVDESIDDDFMNAF